MSKFLAQCPPLLPLHLPDRGYDQKRQLGLTFPDGERSRQSQSLWIGVGWPAHREKMPALRTEADDFFSQLPAVLILNNL